MGIWGLLADVTSIAVVENSEFLTHFPVGQRLCDLAQFSYENYESWLTSLDDYFEPSDGWECADLAKGSPWRNVPALVLVGELHSLPLIAAGNLLGQFPSVRGDFGVEERYETSDPGDGGESWYLDDSDQLQEGDGWERPGLVAGHAIIRLLYAIGCEPEDRSVLAQIGNFRPEDLGRWSADATVTVTLNPAIDNGPQSRLYLELIRSLNPTQMKVGEIVNLYFAFGSALESVVNGLHAHLGHVRHFRTVRFPDHYSFCWCASCKSGVDDEPPF